MKRAMFSFLTLIVLAGLTGCAHHGRHSSTKACGDNCQSSEAVSDECNTPVRKRCRLCSGRGCKECTEQEQQVAAPGPATGAIAYPYYTTRGPRDFLMKNPQSIGP